MWLTRGDVTAGVGWGRVWESRLTAYGKSGWSWWCYTQDQSCMMFCCLFKAALEWFHIWVLGKDSQNGSAHKKELFYSAQQLRFEWLSVAIFTYSGRSSPSVLLPFQQEELLLWGTSTSATAEQAWMVNRDVTLAAFLSFSIWELPMGFSVCCESRISSQPFKAWGVTLRGRGVGISSGLHGAVPVGSLPGWIWDALPVCRDQQCCHHRSPTPQTLRDHPY